MTGVVQDKKATNREQEDFMQRQSQQRKQEIKEAVKRAIEQNPLVFDRLAEL
jgi:hypothetical protein